MLADASRSLTVIATSSLQLFHVTTRGKELVRPAHSSISILDFQLTC